MCMHQGKKSEKRHINNLSIVENLHLNLEQRNAFREQTSESSPASIARYTPEIYAASFDRRQLFPMFMSQSQSVSSASVAIH